MQLSRFSSIKIKQIEHVILSALSIRPFLRCVFTDPYAHHTFNLPILLIFKGRVTLGLNQSDNKVNPPLRDRITPLAVNLL